MTKSNNDETVIEFIDDNENDDDPNRFGSADGDSDASKHDEEVQTSNRDPSPLSSSSLSISGLSVGERAASTMLMMRVWTWAETGGKAKQCVLIGCCQMTLSELIVSEHQSFLLQNSAHSVRTNHTTHNARYTYNKNVHAKAHALNMLRVKFLFEHQIRNKKKKREKKRRKGK